MDEDACRCSPRRGVSLWMGTLLAWRRSAPRLAGGGRRRGRLGRQHTRQVQASVDIILPALRLLLLRH